MTRQFIALFSFLCLSVLSAFADNQEIAINLNPGNNYAETVNLKDMAEMVVMALPTNDNESAHIVVQLKNTTGDSSGLLMFNVKYTEKETKDLKKEFFKIEWPDWLKARNTLKATTGLKPKVHFIDLGDSSILPLQIPDYKKNNNSFKIALTLYGCKITDRDKNTAQPKKVKINSEYSFPINILVELGPDTEFEALKDKCEAFVQEINKKTFCPFDTHKKHKDLNGQLIDFKNKRDEKLKEIYDFANDHNGIMRKEIEGTKYEKLVNDIQQAYNDKMKAVQDNDSSAIVPCPPGPITKTCKQCGLIIGKGKGKCHFNGNHPYCDTHKNKLVGVKGGCPKNHPGPGHLSWKEANTQLDAISSTHMGCEKAKKKAKSILNKAQNSPDDGYKTPAMRKYNNIMKCK